MRLCFSLCKRLLRSAKLCIPLCEAFFKLGVGVGAAPSLDLELAASTVGFCLESRDHRVV